MERNLCHETGCPDLCCTDKFSRFSPQEIADIFPEAVRLPWDEEVKWLFKGVYVLGGEGKDKRHLVFIRGRCPNNTEGCKAPYKPRMCQTHGFAGAVCNSFRKDEKLAPIEVGVKIK